MSYQDQIDKTRIPRHIAIIMDGNGRWAEQQGKERSEGHAKGVKVARQTLENSIRLGVEYITLYTFSTENWKRPQSEIATLMKLLYESIEVDIFMKNDVRLRVIGDMEKLPKKIQIPLQKLIDVTSGNKRACLVLALSYSSRWEISRAARLLAQQVKEGKIEPESIDENTFATQLATSFMPDPDLIIRTGGEFRLSNYLMWQASYSELYFTDTYWPDFNNEELCKAIYNYQQRERRYGLTSAQVSHTEE